ncbi:MAG: hypothetical protein DSO07_07465 [Thermoproteota archaeon]|jgi:hypothetical protein|uniref:Uncharacterized protein n=1 Tax=Candidatus Methanodesulfokora washburnensis TaxID=2478471 RepID=A0A429GFZ3_9CREN|nr:hypothetical protein D6D85_12460 [Candidatus Methanodesulfokores washburnensis]TDA40866.1 MAG: hypothetical protein DSO07_07465 [Candidatus Korarchaeota archaeon]
MLKIFPSRLAFIVLLIDVCFFTFRLIRAITLFFKKRMDNPSYFFVEKSLLEKLAFYYGAQMCAERCLDGIEKVHKVGL